MKQALGIFPSGDAAEFAAAIFGPGYELTVVTSAIEAVILAGRRRFDLVVFATFGGCPSATWRGVELMRETCSSDLLIAVLAESPDHAFFRAAQRFDAAVVGLPLDVALPSGLEPTALG